jgi:hypothetical protein
MSRSRLYTNARGLRDPYRPPSPGFAPVPTLHDGTVVRSADLSPAGAPLSSNAGTDLPSMPLGVGGPGDLTVGTPPTLVAPDVTHVGNPGTLPGVGGGSATGGADHEASPPIYAPPPPPDTRNFAVRAWEDATPRTRLIAVGVGGVLLGAALTQLLNKLARQ